MMSPFPKWCARWLTQALLFLAGLLWTSATASPVINELFFHPRQPGSFLEPTGPEDVRQEWIELYHTGTTTVNVSGWQFTRGISYTFPPGTTLPPGGFLVIAADVATFQAMYPGVGPVLGNWNGSLSNNGETIELCDAVGNVIDTLKYDTEGDWSARRKLTEADERDRRGYAYGWRWWNEADGGGASLELVQPALPRNQGQNWSASSIEGGTPGAPNSTRELNAAPLILEPTHAPLAPRSSQSVRVSARLVDEQTTGLSAFVRWRVSAMTPGSFTVVPMRDDGEEGDLRRGDGVFTALLPPQSHGTVVEYRIEATDANGQRRSWPRVHASETAAPRDNALYQVDDTTYTGSAPLYRIIQPVAELAELDSEPFSGNNQSSEQYLACFVGTTGGVTEVRQQCSVRIRGAGSRSSRPRNVRLNLPNNAPWNGMTGFNINARFSYLQVLGSRLAQASGLQVANAWPVSVRFNGQNRAASNFIWPGGASTNYPFHYGLYASVEPLNREFIDRQFPDDSTGNLYSMRSTRQAEWRVATGAPSTYANYYRNEGWDKDNNTSEFDWSDLHHFVSIMTQSASSPNDDYLTRVSEVLDVDQWILAQAVSTVLTDGETKLVTGRDDDYSLYRGADGRMRYLQHDLDTILGLGDGDAIGLNRLPYTIFDQVEGGARGDVFDKLIPFYQQPEVLAQYYATLRRLLTEGPFTEGAFEALVTAELTRGGWNESDIKPVRESILTFMAARRADILNQISRPLTATAPQLPQEYNYFFTDTSTATISGTYQASQAARVLINGQPASINPRTGTYTGVASALQSGLNRVTVEEVDAQGGHLRYAWVDVWRPDQPTTLKSGALSQSETWTAAGGPYLLTADVTIGNGITLTIQPGTTIFFVDGAELIITGSGRILAEGSPYQRIRFSREPGSAAQGGGLVLNGASSEQRFAWCDFEFFGASPAMAASQSVVSLRHCSWSNCAGVYLELDRSSFVCEDSIFASRANPDGWPPAPDTPGRESLRAPPLVRGVNGLPNGGYGLFQRTLFGHTHGPEPVLSFSGGQRPQPVVQLRDNLFLAATGDHVRLSGADALICGNIFLNAHADAARLESAAASSALAGGPVASQVEPPTWTVYGNLFSHVDQVVRFEGLGNDPMTAAPRVAFFNNTVSRVTDEAAYPGSRDGIAAFFFVAKGTLEAHQNVFSAITSPTAGAGLDGANIRFFDNVLPQPWNEPAVGNLIADATFDPRELAELEFSHVRRADDYARLSRLARRVFTLAPQSPGQGAGPGGSDWGGAPFPALVQALNAPAPLTAAASATFSFGPISAAPLLLPRVFTEYRWSLDGGAVSAPVPLNEPLHLNGLAPGLHTLRVWGRNDAHNSGEYSWHPEPLIISWTVNPTFTPAVRINEVLARNEGSYTHGGERPDFIELHNPGLSPENLSGWGVSDDPANPMKFTFPPGAQLSAGEFLVLHAAASGQGAGYYTGFALNADGEHLTLTKPNGETVDAVSFGFQLPDLSLGRVGPSAQWQLNFPTPGEANKDHPVTGPSAVLINEWLAAHEQSHREDMVELYNTSTLPADVSGCWFSDDPLQPQVYALKPLSFVAPRGFAVWQADDTHNTRQDGNLPFKLGAFYDWLVWSAPDGRRLDQVAIGYSRTDESMGRVPDGGPAIQVLDLPSFGLTNVNGVLPVIETTVIPLVPHGHRWAYQDQTFDSPATDGQGHGWWEADYALEAEWPVGPSPLGRDTGMTSMRHPGTGVPPFFGTDFGVRGTYQSSRLAYFFRTTFHFPETSGEEWTLRLSRWIDDGYVLFLNGEEIDRRSMNGAAPRPWNTRATSSVDNASEEVRELPRGLVQPGLNTLAAQVHQDDTSSGDIVFSVAFEAVRERVTPGVPDPERERMKALLAHLRLTELMFDPPEGNEYEYLELTNLSSEETLQLEGVRLIEGIDFVFPALTLLPGARVVLVKNPAAFQAKYGSLPLLVGPYDGQLSNQGEALSLALPLPYTALIQRFRYEPTWFAQAGGGGHSLEYIGHSHTGTERGRWAQSDSWQASKQVGGSPGRDHHANTFAAWLTAHGLTSAADDEDRDKLPPLLEYAWGLSPWQAEMLPDEGSVALTSDNSQFSVLLPTETPADVSLSVEASDQLSASIWQILTQQAPHSEGWTGPAEVQITTESNGRRRLTVIDPTPASPQRFYRLRAQRREE